MLSLWYARETVNQFWLHQNQLADTSVGLYVKSDLPAGKLTLFNFLVPRRIHCYATNYIAFSIAVYLTAIVTEDRTCFIFHLTPQGKIKCGSFLRYSSTKTNWRWVLRQSCLDFPRGSFASGEVAVIIVYSALHCIGLNQLFNIWWRQSIPINQYQIDQNKVKSFTYFDRSWRGRPPVYSYLLW